jgi:hypothetical protein
LTRTLLTLSLARSALSRQLRLDLAESPAPAEALWELLGEESRQAAEALLAVLIARSVAGQEQEEMTGE